MSNQRTVASVTGASRCIGAAAINPAQQGRGLDTNFSPQRLRQPKRDAFALVILWLVEACLRLTILVVSPNIPRCTRT